MGNFLSKENVMDFQQKLKKYFLGFILLILAACGSEHQSIPEQTQNTSTTNSSSSENPLAPGNLPPPTLEASSGESSEQVGTQFFQRKEIWDTFSDPLKQKVSDHYLHAQTLIGEGSGGRGYYNTLFGRVSPRFNSNSGSEVHSQSIQGPDGKKLMYEVFALTSSCSHPSTFLCVNRPGDRDASVVDSVVVEGSINLSDTALFSSNDPVILISVFKNGSETVGEFPLQQRDMGIQTQRVGEGEEARDIQVATFSRTVPLNGSGEYTLVVTAFQNMENSVEPVAEARTVSRQTAPQIHLVDIMPPESGNLYPENQAQRRAAIRPEATVSVPYVNVRVKLSEANYQNVGVIYENYSVDTNGQNTLRYRASGKFTENVELPGEGGISTATVNQAKVTLFAGLNRIKIIAHNKRLNELGFAPVNPSIIEFNLTNIIPNPSIKLISPQAGSIVQGSRAGENVEIRFCMTDLPNLPGRQITTQPGQCVAQWPQNPTEKPRVKFNGVPVADAQVTRSMDGTYIARVKPYVGNNLFSIDVTHSTYGAASTLKGAFGFGKVNKLYENGDLVEGQFLKKALSIDISSRLIRDDVKKALLKLLNSEDFKSSLASFFKNDDTGPRTACTETFYNDNPSHSELSVDSGDTSIEFIEEGFSAGDFEIHQMESTGNNRITLDVALKGLHGEANLRGLRLPVRVEIGGRDASFIPLSISISELRIKIGIKFQKNREGVQVLEIERLAPQIPAVEIIGNDSFGKYLHVNSTRNPLMAALEQFEQQTGAFSMQFRKGVESSILCGVENKLNHNTIGLGKWISDLEKITAYNNQNPFRIPLEFDLLNKLVGVDIAYDVLRAESIRIDSTGLHMQDVPLRITPSPRVLLGLPDALRNSLIGSISDPVEANEIPLYRNLLNEVHTFGLKLSEAALNQALFAANLAGMLDLDIDPNFYSNNDIIPIAKAASTVGTLLSADVDLNQNGVQDDANLPILLRLATSKTLAPYIHFLTPTETAELAQKINAGLGNGYSFNSNLKYFIFTLPEAELSFYRVMPIPAEQGGEKSYCFLKQDLSESSISSRFRDYQASNPGVENLVNGMVNGQASGENGVCAPIVSSKFEKPAGMQSCPNVESEGFQLEYEEVSLPVRNGPIISAVPVAEGEKEKPILKLKGSISFYGVFQGVFRETKLQDRFRISLNGNTPVFEDLSRTGQSITPSNFMRIKVLKLNPAKAILDLRIAENYTNLSLEDVQGSLQNIINEAFNNCANFNEIQIPILDRFPNASTSSDAGLMANLRDFGIRYLDIGDSEQERPVVQIDENRDALELGLHLGLCFEGENCNNMTSLLGTIPTSINVSNILQQSRSINSED